MKQYCYFRIYREEKDKVKDLLEEQNIIGEIYNDPLHLVCFDFVEDCLEYEDTEYDEDEYNNRVHSIGNYLYKEMYDIDSDTNTISSFRKNLSKIYDMWKDS